MPESLAASFLSGNKLNNIAEPGDTVTFNLQSPPKSATDVVVTVLEDVAFLNGKTAVRDRVVGGFRGGIEDGKFKTAAIFGAPLPPEPDPVSIRVAAAPAPGSPGLFAHMPEPETVESHTLRIKVEGTVKGRRETFEGTSRIQMEYSLAMVVPNGPGNQDPSLGVVAAWARQWKRFKPAFRHVEPLAVTRLTRNIVPADYDPLIAALVNAARAAKSGVVALAVGHGDDGEGKNVAWFNSIPENFPPPEGDIPFQYRLDIDDLALADGDSTGGVAQVTPFGANRIKLDALDRIADALKDTGIRRLLLHTCKAGGNAQFMQRLADRMQVPVMAHRETITYTGAATASDIKAHYDPDAPVSPRDERFWPVRRLSGVFRPKKQPKRFGP